MRRNQHRNPNLSQVSIFVLLAVFFSTLLSACTPKVDALLVELTPTGNAVARILYFYSDDCPYCAEIKEDLIIALSERCGDHLEMKEIDINDPAGYRVFIDTEMALVGETGRWAIPAVVVGDQAFLGESAIRKNLVTHLQCVYAAGGNDWPAVSTLNDVEVTNVEQGASGSFNALEGIEICASEETEVDSCAAPMPIFVLYFTDSDCENVCDRTRYDLRYLQGEYPQMQFEERDMTDDAELASKLADEYQISDDVRAQTPAVIVGSDYLAGDALTLETLRMALENYVGTGAPATWYLLESD